MRRTAPFIGVALGFAIASGSGAVEVDGRTCSADGSITVGGELCEPGSVNVAQSPFELHAKKRAIAINADPALGLPPAFDAYVFDFSASEDSGSVAPPVFHVPKPGGGGASSRIRFKLFNELPPVLDDTFMVNDSVPGGDQPVNIHTHGLLVRPMDGHGRGAYGDFVGVLTCPADGKAVCPADMESTHATEMCGLARAAASGKTCPGAKHVHREGDAFVLHGHEVLLKPIPYDIEVPASHPASLNWIHPHAHEIASPQVGAGLAGVLTIGTPCSDHTLPDEYCSNPASGEPTLKPDRLRERALMLKDFQIFEHRQGAGGENTPPSAEGYRIVPTCVPDPGKAPPRDGDPADAVKSNRYRIFDRGFCPFNADDSVNLAGNWLFTVNGQIQPSITMKAGLPELWRIANLSSNATYRLSLCKDAVIPDSTDPALGDCATKQNFQIVSLDGGQSPKAKPLDGTEVLLPPGARAEIIVQPPADGPIQLVQKGFEAPDLYPPVILATATTGTGTANVAPAPIALSDAKPEPRVNVRPAAFPEPDDCRRKPQTLTQNDWLSLPTTNEVVSIFFGRVSSAPEILTIGMLRGNPEVSLDDATRAHIQACLAGADPNSYDCQLFKGSAFHMDTRNLCIKHGSRVTFRLYNLTTETHNFHIHQQKFEVARQFPLHSEPGQHIHRNSPSVAAVIGSQMQRASIAQGDAVLTSHVADSIPLPSVWVESGKPEAGTNPVPEVTMTFDRPEQIGDFVFHCHILEHEDKGMMKRLTVYTP